MIFNLMRSYPFRFPRKAFSLSGPLLKALFGLAVIIPLSSCTLVAYSKQIAAQTQIPILRPGDGILAEADGKIPYQRWRLLAWGNRMRYVWLAGNYDFRRFRGTDIILYFHGMHSKDYYRDFRGELAELATKNSRRPFLFVGFVDTPFTKSSDRGKHRWKALVPVEGQRPDRLFRAANEIFRAVRVTFPNIRKSGTKIVMAGFSGGGRVLDSVGSWLASSPRDDPYARVFRTTLNKICYFDCWFDPEVLDTVPALLKSSPSMRIIGTVHMKKPRKHAKIMADKFRMRTRKSGSELVGWGGRLKIFASKKSHWDAMISSLCQALDR